MQMLPGIEVGSRVMPKTEGIKYAGSKAKLLPQILELVNQAKPSTVLDGFSGTTRVSQALAKSNYSVISNDLAVWSKVFATCYLLANQNLDQFHGLIEHLNNLPPVDGWFTDNYGGTDVLGQSVGRYGNKTPWQIHNTRKLDAIRQEIEQLKLSNVEKSVALTSLILALDRVDNTIGHYASYLKHWSPRSYQRLTLKVPQIFESEGNHEVFQRDIFEIIPELQVDLAYYDPPYGSNNEKMPPSRVRYAAYYHVWKSVCLFDHPPLFGRANRRSDSRDKRSASIFEEFRRNGNGRFAAVEAISKLITSTNARWIVLSYSSGGRATAQELYDVMVENGCLRKVVEIEYRKNVMSTMKWTHEWTRDSSMSNKEYLFLLEKK